MSVVVAAARVIAVLAKSAGIFLFSSPFWEIILAEGVSLGVGSGMLTCMHLWCC